MVGVFILSALVLVGILEIILGRDCVRADIRLRTQLTSDAAILLLRTHGLQTRLNISNDEVFAPVPRSMSLTGGRGGVSGFSNNARNSDRNEQDQASANGAWSGLLF